MSKQIASVLSCLLIFLVTTNAVQLQHSMTICCNNGTHHANQERTCEDIDTKPIPDIGSEDQEDIKHCRVIMRSCCVQELQRGMCIKGLDHRAANGSCDRVRPDGCASIEKTCCECCELGMKAFWESAMAPCEGTDLGTECDFAFRECCQRASSANDMDECSIAKDNNHQLCTAKCVNLINSYICECPDGYVLDSTDDMSCIRERDPPSNLCDTSYCEQRCVPDGSSYLCACHDGFNLREDGYSCSAADSNPSTSLACMTAMCEYGCRPVGSTSFECYCDQGFDLDTDRVSCVDTNECTEVADICSLGEVCFNIHGSYECIPEPDCSAGLSYSVDTSRCEDINECEGDSVCPLHKLCRNYIGGFYCELTECREGEHYDETNRDCRDVDECAIGLHDCPEGARCDNLPGSYRCTRILPCGTGYTVNATSQLCTDIDECFQDTDDCPPSFYCQNTIGSYKCRPCRQGFRADNSDGCSLDIDECEEVSDVCPPGQTCINSYGSYRCNPGCPPGFQYNDVYRECRDINECTQGPNACGANQFCVNTDGSFECGCRNGMEFNQVTRECNDIDECEKGTHNCRYNEQCFNYEGAFTCQQRCQLNYKYNASVGCVDINECERAQYPCLGNSECVNLPGSFRCQQCPRGQIANRDARRCEDVDECKYQGASCMGGCKNTFGSYMCACPSGYDLVNRYNCRDIDECRRNIHNCSSQSACFNTRGGFKCKNVQCPQYFRKEINGEDVRCVKVSLCPNNDFNCVSDPVKLVTYNKIALPSVTRELTESLQLLRLQIGDLSYTQVYGLKFILTQGNERGLFKVVKDYQLSRNGRYVAIGTLFLERAVMGPYETDLRLEMQLFNRDEQLISITAAVFSIDISANPY